MSNGTTTTLDAAVAARLAKRSTKELRAMYATAFGRSAEGMTRDGLLRELALRRAPSPPPQEPAPQAPEQPHTRKRGGQPKAQRKPRAERASKQTRRRDPRLPAPGGVIERTYKGKTYRVEVLERGFRFDGEEWSSLTAIALAITGYGSISGTLFFGVARRIGAAAQKEGS